MPLTVLNVVEVGSGKRWDMWSFRGGFNSPFRELLEAPDLWSRFLFLVCSLSALTG